MIHWTYLGWISAGTGGTIGPWVTIQNTTRNYFRLQYSDSQSSDFDNDGVSNYNEVMGSNPTLPFNPDSDGDTMPDGWELAAGLNPNLKDGGVDADYDGVSSAREYRMGTNPLAGDTDQDGSADNQDTDPLLSSVHPPVFDTYWRGMGGYYYSDDPNTQTGWASCNWGFPNSFSPVIAGWTSPALAQSQLQAPVAWPVDFASATALAVPPPAADLRWYFNEYEAGGQTVQHAEMQNYERYFRCRRDFGYPWQQEFTLLRLVLPQTPGSENEFIMDALESFEKIELPIPPNETVSPGKELRIPAADPAWQPPGGSFQSLQRRHYFTELHRVPPVLPANADFDEGITDSTTGRPKPDHTDESLVLSVNVSWDPDPKLGSPVLDDLHQGWFGISPAALYNPPPFLPLPGQPLPPYSFWQGASVKIKKLVRTDSATGRPESGHIRFWVTKGDGAGTGSSANWQQHRIDPYDRADPAFTATELVGWVYGPLATVPAPAAGVRYWVEGITPGKCTLEFTCIRGTHTITHEQTFEVGCHWNPDQWREVARQYLYLESDRARSGTGPAVDIDGLNISQGFLPNRDHARAIYQYYGSLFFERENEFHWPGLAKRAGAAVYWGLSDSQWGIEAQLLYANLPGGAYAIQTTLQTALNFQQALLTGMRDVYNDIGWQFMAYHVGGIEAMKYLHENDYINDDFLLAWTQMSEGARLNNQNLIDSASKLIAEQEQRIVLAPAFLKIAQIKLSGVPLSWILSKYSTNPVPGAMSFSNFDEDGDITNFDHRWPWIEDSGFGMLVKWRQQGSLGRPPLVAPLIEDLAQALSFASAFGLPIK